MRVECEQSGILKVTAPSQSVKDRLALSALCNNSSEYPFNSCPNRAVSNDRSGLSQNLRSSSNSSSKKSPACKSFCSEGIDPPTFRTSRWLPPISDVKLFTQQPRSAPEKMVKETDLFPHEMRMPVHSRAPHQFAYHDIHSPGLQIVPRKPYLTSSPALCNVPANARTFSQPPMTFTQLPCTGSILSNSRMPEVQSSVMSRRSWSPVEAPQPTALFPFLSGSQATSSVTEKTYHSQSTARICTNCGAMQTRQWVRGENQTWLCHSCGQFWRKNGYSRPRALWNRPTFKRSSRKLKLSQGVVDTRRTKGSMRQTVSSSFLDGKKMIQLETCLPRLHSGSVVQNAVKISNTLRTR